MCVCGRLDEMANEISDRIGSKTRSIRRGMTLLLLYNDVAYAHENHEYKKKKKNTAPHIIIYYIVYNTDSRRQ